MLVSLECDRTQHSSISIVGAAGEMRLLRSCGLSCMAGRIVLFLHPTAHPQTVGFGSVFRVGWVVGAAAVARVGGCRRRTGCGGGNGSRGGGG